MELSKIAAIAALLILQIRNLAFLKDLDHAAVIDDLYVRKVRA